MPVLDLSRHDELAWVAHLVRDLQAASPGVEPLIVGALARDLMLHYGYGFAIERATTDVDFALAVASWGEYAATHEALIDSGLFAVSRTAGHKFSHAKFGCVDVIPFGAVEGSDSIIVWPPAGDEMMTVIGYAEAAAAAIRVVLPGDRVVKVVSLPTLAVLKVIAWKDRHRATRGKDAADLRLLLRRYLEAGNLERLDVEFPQVATDAFDFESTSAWLLGYDARVELQRHSTRFEQVMGTLSGTLRPELDPDGGLTLAVQLLPHAPGTAIALLAAFQAGLDGATIP